VVIDDVHVADVSAMLLSRFVARTLSWRPLLLLLTRRTEMGGMEPATPAWPAVGEATLITLGCLDLPETECRIQPIMSNAERGTVSVPGDSSIGKTGVVARS
jgi:hypothetical protein